MYLYMQYITPKASFSLKCNDISTSDTFADYPVTNNVGTINASRTSITWYSVNLENILGDLWNRADLFNLRLRYISYNSQVAWGASLNDQMVYFQMDGPTWTNANYDTGRGCITSLSTIGGVNYGTTATSISFDDTFINTLRKQKTVNITISYVNANFLVPSLNANAQFPRTAFYFDLTPIIESPPMSVLSSSTKCAVLNTYYLGLTTNNNNIDMYALLGRENFELGAKYNLVFKYAQSAIWAGMDATQKGVMFNIVCNGMRFQNWETAIGKVAGNAMQTLTYGTFQGCVGNTTTTQTIYNVSSGIMTFTLESQIATITIRLQSLVNNTELNGGGTSNTFLLFDIYKCV